MDNGYRNYNTGETATNALNQSKIAGRVNNDIERVRTLVSHLNISNDRIMRIASTLGYYDTPKNDNSAARDSNPVSITLHDVLSELEHVVANVSASLNLFD